MTVDRSRCIRAELIPNSEKDLRHSFKEWYVWFTDSSRESVINKNYRLIC